MIRIRSALKRSPNISLAIFLAFWQLMIPIGVIMANNSTAAAAANCTVDVQGANDEPNQKDLTKMCTDAGATPVISWQWDDIAWPGGNTGDACALFDNDNNGLTDYAVCVTVGGNPAAQQANSPRIYSCGDTRPENCTSPVLVSGPYSTACTVTALGDDPFNASNDTFASCTVNLNEVGSGVLLDVCSYPSQQPNSAYSDCIIYKPNSAKIEVRKVLSPAADSGLFDLKINGTNYANDVGNGGTTGQIVVTAGNVTVLEAEVAPTDLASYTTTVVCRDLNGTGAIIGQSSPTGSDTRQLSITAADGKDIVCIFTNTRQAGTITLIKNVTNDNGGTASSNDFGLSVGGTQVTSGQTSTLSPGSYAINEVGLAGYNFVSITGTGCPAQLGGTVALANNQNITCTITNNDQPGQIRVVKSVTNDNGGNAAASDFQLYINGLARNQNQYYSTNAGTYTVSEDTVNGYVQTGITCIDDASQQAAAHPVNLSPGQSVTCTIVNNDAAPRLTVIKNVTNDNGGTILPAGFQLTVNAGNVDQNSAIAGISANTSYTVSEVPKTGYAAAAVTCIDDDTNQVVSTSQTANGSVSLNEGQHVTCTVYNDDIAPKLTVVKTVTNDDGGLLEVSDFPLFVGGISVVSGQQNEFTAGLYVVSETNQPGYTPGDWGTDCGLGGNITLEIGGVYTCTINNDDQPATIIVDKVVTNDDGGQASDDDWNLLVNQTSVNDEATNTFNGSVLYTISEQNGPTGYAQTSISCQDITNARSPVAIAHPFTAALGHAYHCTITNDDQPANLTLVKTVTNNNGGTASPSDFPVFITGQAASWGSNTVNADSYTISETTLPGYQPSGWSGDCSADGNVTLLPGQTKTCAITNDDVTPSLTVTKLVLNPFGNPLPASAFPLFVDGVPVLSGVSTTQFDAGSHTITETQQTGYNFTGVSGDCVQVQGIISVLLRLADASTCTITNTAIQPQLIVIKHVINDDGGDKTSSDFTMTINGNSVVVPNFAGEESPGTNINLNEGSYSADELADAGYTKTLGADCTGTIAIGETKTCTITNDDVARATVVVTKYHDFNQNGTQDDNEPVIPGWEILLGETPGTTGDVGTTTFANVLPGRYTLGETQQDGWNLSDISCDKQFQIEQEQAEGEEGYTLVASPGSTVNCAIGNFHDPALNITKANNRPNPTTVGDTVTYTLSVSVPNDQGAVFNTTVLDLPPENFEYVPGSWTAISSTRGDLKAASVTPEPTYASPGSWILGNLLPGEIVTLTYKAKIASSVITGTYPDTAFAAGCPTTTSCSTSSPSAVLANVSTGSTTPFVGTRVAISTPAVLGASTTRLVNTGAADIWRTMLLASFIILVAIVSFAATRNQKGDRS